MTGPIVYSEGSWVLTLYCAGCAHDDQDEWPEITLDVDARPLIAPEIQAAMSRHAELCSTLSWQFTVEGEAWCPKCWAGIQEERALEGLMDGDDD